MKKLLSIIFFSLIWCTYSSAAFLTEKEIIYKEISKCVKDGKWICEQSKIDEISTNYYKQGGQIKDCSLTNYKAPCRCDWRNLLLKRNTVKLK